MPPGCEPKRSLRERCADSQPSGHGVGHVSIITSAIWTIEIPFAAISPIAIDTVVTGGVASMHKVQSVDLPAGKTVTFGPGGLHLMVISPTPQHANATFRIQIELESGRAETISFDAAKSGG